MKLALFSDIHGNLSALEAVLEAIAGHEGVDATVCAGDLVYLGASPAEVLERLRAAGVTSLRGNCEEYVTGQRPVTAGTAHLQAIFQEHVAWNRERLADGDIEYLRRLPLTASFEPEPGRRLLVCHATPGDADPPFAIMQEPRNDELARIYAGTGAEVIAFGHWHGPFLANIRDGAGSAVTLLNISSVSIPYDGQARAAYTIAEWAGGFWSFRQHRVAYDLTPELERIRSRGMPRPPWPDLGVAPGADAGL